MLRKVLYQGKKFAACPLAASSGIALSESEGLGGAVGKLTTVLPSPAAR